VLDARRDDLDAARRVAVVPPELPLLLRAADADGVRAADDLHLGQLAPRRLRVATLGLDPSQGVEGADERQVHLVLDAVAGHAREPVVGVDEVGAVVTAQVVDDAGRELPDDVEEPLLGEGRIACVDVDHAEARFDHHLLGQVGVPTTNVGRRVDAGLGEGGRELADVHVHAAAVAHTRLGQG
jgi:hypothetical protein